MIRLRRVTAAPSDGCAVVIQPTADEVRAARRWSARSAELAPARAGVASRRPKGGLNWVPFGQVKEQW
mgnify:CR=1 FL=1